MLDNAVALPPSQPPAALAPAGLAGRIAGLPPKRRLALGAGVAALLAIVLVLAMWSSRPDYRVLYANLSDKDGGAIVAQLSQMNVPYRHAEGGGAILVPADKVHDLRLKLASQGLPKGSTVGFELMDNARFGITQFQERLTFQRGLEGELTRSIQALAAVESARVHLALPNQNGFFREQQKPSASVLLQLHAGRTLDRAQIAGIVHLVSSSVPELAPKAVSILDQTGALLTESGDGRGGSLDAQQLQHVSRIEALYTRRIVELLEPVLGRDNLRAQVTAELDFSESESTSEQYRPNQGEQPATVRSQQTLDSSQAAPLLPTGVPGAATNQPPQPSAAPVNGAVQPLQAAPGNAPGTAAGPLRRETVTNYEVDRTVRVTRAASGTIKRLNAAVVVNHRSTTDPRGRTVSTELPPEEIEKLTALVRETIGFNAGRGDSVKVISAPFSAPATGAPELPAWRQPWVLELLREAAIPSLLALVALAIVFGVVRPALRAAAPPPPAPLPPARQLDAVVGDDEPLPALDAQGRPAGAAGAPDSALAALPALGGPAADLHKLENARRFAKDNPVAVANIVRAWVNKEAG